MGIEQQKQDIIDSYNDLLDDMTTGIFDNIGYENILKENFKLKLDNLIKLIQDGIPKNGPGT